MNKLKWIIVICNIICALCVLVILGIAFYKDIQMRKKSHNPFRELRYSYTFSPNMIAAKFSDYLIKRFYKTYSPYPKEYWIIVAYINQSPFASMMLPQIYEGKIKKILIVWGPALYKDAWSQSYIYRISAQPNQKYYPHKLILNFVRPNYEKSITIFLEPNHERTSKVAIYSNNWFYLSKRIKPSEKIIPQIPCWCKWHWIGIICHSNKLSLKNVWFDSNPILYYYSFQGNGVIVAAWLPKTVDMSKGIEGLVYYHNNQTIKIKLYNNKYRYNENLIVFWGLPKEFLKYCPCKI